MKLWKGRFEEELDILADKFNKSIYFDKILYEEDIKGSLAHVKMLNSIGIVDSDEYNKLRTGLEEILSDIKVGKILIDDKSEDIHSFIEEELTKRIGDIGKKLHTGRSRNDQVALDMKLYSKKKSKELMITLKDLIETFIKVSKENIDTIMPGYTHLQNAQVVTFAHHLMAYSQMFYRDLTRVRDSYERMDYSPLGSGALATTTYPIDRFMTAKELGFKGPTENSMDSVSDKDFIIETSFCCSLIMAHLSRLAEELIIWSSSEFKFIEISDSYSTGSSIMPQKKNPDMAELIRGKSGRSFGVLMGLLTMLKGTPMSYNKDFQEDKEGYFDTLETTLFSLKIMASMVDTMEVNKTKMREATKTGFLNATDLADYLVGKGIPFRDAYKVVGEIVLYAQKNELVLEDIEVCKYKEFNYLFGDDIYEFIDIDNCLNKRNVYGGPSSESVKLQIKNLELKLKNLY